MLFCEKKHFKEFVMQVAMEIQSNLFFISNVDQSRRSKVWKRDHHISGSNCLSNFSANQRLMRLFWLLTLERLPGLMAISHLIRFWNITFSHCILPRISQIDNLIKCEKNWKKIGISCDFAQGMPLTWDEVSNLF